MTKMTIKPKYGVPNRSLRLSMTKMPHVLTIIPTGRACCCDTVLIMSTDQSRVSNAENLMESFKRVEKKRTVVS